MTVAWVHSGPQFGPLGRLVLYAGCAACSRVPAEVVTRIVTDVGV